MIQRLAGGLDRSLVSLHLRRKTATYAKFQQSLRQTPLWFVCVADEEKQTATRHRTRWVERLLVLLFRGVNFRCTRAQVSFHCNISQSPDSLNKKSGSRGKPPLPFSRSPNAEQRWEVSHVTLGARPTTTASCFAVSSTSGAAACFTRKPMSR